MLTARHALMFRLLAVVLVWRLLTMLGSPAAVAALPQEASALGEMVRLPGHVLPALKGATPVAPLPSAEDDPLTLTVVLRRTDQAGFDRYLQEVYDPRSPEFRHFYSQGEIAQRFGPTQEVYEGVLAYLQRNGFTLVQGSANRMTLTVRGTRAQAERAFEVHIRDYEAGGRRFFANDTDPAVPRGLAADIQAVAGLSSAEPYASISFNELGAVLANVARTIGALLVPLLLTAARTVGTEVAMGCAQAPKACLIIAFNAVFIIDVRHYPE